VGHVLRITCRFAERQWLCWSLAFRRPSSIRCDALLSADRSP
jgi:hypothetical protein